jgi:hypothetical protein
MYKDLMETKLENGQKKYRVLKNNNLDVPVESKDIRKAGLKEGSKANEWVLRFLTPKSVADEYAAYLHNKKEVPPKEGESLHYENLFNVEDGFIWSTTLRKSSGIYTEIPGHETYMSDVTAKFYLKIAEEHKTSPHKLHLIGANEIDNIQTRSIMDKALDRVGKNVDTHTFTPTDHPEGFYALLRTPNIGWILRMLKDYEGNFGPKKIDSILATRFHHNGKEFWSFLAKIGNR